MTTGLKQFYQRKKYSFSQSFLNGRKYNTIEYFKYELLFSPLTEIPTHLIKKRLRGINRTTENVHNTSGRN